MPPEAFVVVLVPTLKTEDVGVVLFHLVAPVALAALVFKTTYSVFANKLPNLVEPVTKSMLEVIVCATIV